MGCAVRAERQLAWPPGLHHADVPEFNLVLVVCVSVIVGIILFGVVVGLGTLAVRWLSLASDPAEGATFEPPLQPIVPPGDPAAARTRAAGFLAAAAAGQRAHAILMLARGCNDHADWIARQRPESAITVRAAAASVGTAADQARAAFAAGDDAGLAAAELSARTAAAHVEAQAAGLPDVQAAERRKLLLLTAALIASLALAAGAMWLR